MKKETEYFDIGIVGCGPRGLSALESLYLEASKANLTPKAIVFEKTEFFGAGQVWNPKQPSSNWMNVSDRGIAIEPREEFILKETSVPFFPNFQDWIGYSDHMHKEHEKDTFQHRSKLGEYLRQRFLSIAVPLTELGLLLTVNGEVDFVIPEKDHLQISVIGGSSYICNETVLTVGHQPIALDEQLRSWQRGQNQQIEKSLFTQPYPLNRLLQYDKLSKDSTVALRGFGLASIDIIRSLTEGRGGTFEILDERTREMRYIASGQEPHRIVPFSLDGQPLAPKPLNAYIDSLYLPTKDQLSDYSEAVRASIHNGETPKSIDFLVDAILPLISQKYSALKCKALENEMTTTELEHAIKSWLLDEDFSHELILSKEQGAYENMRNFVNMANGQGKVSLDFCCGHVWRQCQPTMYKLLSFAPLSDNIIVDIVALDERLKRYSYGPPIDSLQQLLCLVRENILTFDFVSDPKIDFNGVNWEITKKSSTINADIMVNSILDSPQVKKVQTPLIESLLKGRIVKPLHDDLGICTSYDGLVQTEREESDHKISVLGRLAKGTLIGVDAIAECFGPRSELWAEGVIKRMTALRNNVGR